MVTFTTNLPWICINELNNEVSAEILDEFINESLIARCENVIFSIDIYSSRCRSGLCSRNPCSVYSTFWLGDIRENLSSSKGEYCSSNTIGWAEVSRFGISDSLLRAFLLLAPN